MNLHPFDDGSSLRFKAFNDLTVIFGQKGTGKSCILRAIAKHYSERGIEAKVYESASDRLDELFDIKGKDLSINLNSHNINYCSDEIDALRRSSEVPITALSKYLAYFASKTTNRRAKTLLLKDIEPEEESSPKRQFHEFRRAVETTKEFLTFLSEDASLKEEFDEEELGTVTRILSGVLDRLRSREWTNFSDWKQICLLNAAIALVRNEIERKTGTPAKPTTTGFRNYSMNRIRIEVSAAAIVKSVDTTIPMGTEPIGNLGSHKGNLQLRTEFKFQDGSITDGSLSVIASGVRKGSQKRFIDAVRMILRGAYTDDLFQRIAKLNAIDGIEDIDTVNELLLFQEVFRTGGERLCSF